MSHQAPRDERATIEPSEEDYTMNQAVITSDLDEHDLSKQEIGEYINTVCWVVVCMLPVSHLVNGRVVSLDQMYARIVLVSLAVIGIVVNYCVRGRVFRR